MSRKKQLNELGIDDQEMIKDLDKYIKLEDEIIKPKYVMEPEFKRVSLFKKIKLRGKKKDGR